MSLSMTGSNFSAIDNDFYIGSFNSSAQIVSFNKVPNVFTCDKKKTNSNRRASELGDMDIGPVGIDEEAGEEVCLDSTSK